MSAATEAPMKLLDGELVPMTAEDLAQWEADASRPPPVPPFVTRAQALDVMAGFILPDGRALDRAVAEDLQAQLDALADRPDGDPEKIEAKRRLIWFGNAQQFDREHPFLLEFVKNPAYGLTEEMADALFIQAAKR